MWQKLKLFCLYFFYDRYSGTRQMAELLIHHGGNVNDADNDGNNLLITSARAGLNSFHTNCHFDDKLITKIDDRS